MDLGRFESTLGTVFDGWPTPAAQPRTGRFREILASVEGFTSPNVLQLLSHAVGCLGPEERYAEVGCFQGATLIGALAGRPEAVALAIDNFSEFDPNGTNKRSLQDNLVRFGVSEQVDFRNVSFERWFLKEPVGRRFGVFLYDGAHDYRSQLLGLLMAVPHLAPQALIVIDDANFPAVKQATWDFLALRPEARMLWELPTPGNRHPSFWNGLFVIAWEQGAEHRPSWQMLQSGRQPAYLESLRLLEHVQLSAPGGKLRVSPTGPA